MSDKIRKRFEGNVKKIYDLLRKHGRLSITDLIRKSELSGATVRIALARLEENDATSFERIGMAKVYHIGSKE